MRDPMWLPVLCAAAAFIGWQAASVAGSRTVLVARHRLPAGTRLTASLVRTVRWSGYLPGPPLRSPAGTLREAAATGMPLLQGEVGRSATSSGAPSPLVAIPSGVLLSAPPAAPGSRVAVYLASSDGVPQMVCPQASVAAGSTQQRLLLKVPDASLAGLLAALATGKLIVVGHTR